MRVQVFGAFDRDYARNRVLRTGLRRLGVRIDLCGAPAWDSTLLRYAVLLGRHLRRSACDAILVPEFRHKDVPLARLLSSLSSASLVVDPLVSRYDTRVHDWGTVGPASLAAAHSRRVDRAAVRFADLLLCDTGAHARYFEHTYRVPSERCAVVPVGFDDVVFQPLPQPAVQPFQVAFFGSYLPLHGVQTIVEAARLMQRDAVRFLLIGSGQTFGTVERARHEGVRLETSPSLAPSALVQRLKHAQILLGVFGTTPKAARVVPNKVFQSLALGRAVITAATPAIHEFFTPGEHLWTVPAGDAEALVEAIRMLRREAALRGRLAQQGARFVHAHFTPERVARRFLDAGRRQLDWHTPLA
jgi:glycosyltransferase involved in cell wall biosynthesis